MNDPIGIDGGERQFPLGASISDQSVEKLQMLINSLMGAARGALTETEAKLQAIVRTSEELRKEIAERQRAEERLRESEAQNRAILDNAAEGILSFDDQGAIRSFNSSAERIFGFSAEEIIGYNVCRLVPTLFREGHDGIREFKSHVKRVLSSRKEVLGLRKGGSTFPMEIHVSEVHLGAARVFTAIVRDVTERKESERRIVSLAHYDPLTGIPNRRMFFDLLERGLETAKRRGDTLGILFLDLDRFKEINDSLGHSAGDYLLQQFALRLVDSVRISECVVRSSAHESRYAVSRLGGDEFTILLTNLTGPADAANVARGILSALSEPFSIDGQEVFVTTSIGLACCPEHGDDVAELLHKADAAMYYAKKRDRNCYWFYSDFMKAAATRKLVLQSRLQRALWSGGFRLVYQPMCDVVSGHMTRAEALLRWNDPQLGEVAPAEFIPVAEHSGIIVPLGDWVLRTACREALAWQEAGLGAIRVTVNVSARQLRRPGWMETVREILHETRLAPELLGVEITETAILDDDETTNTSLKELHAMGVELTLDDFGTGYSSLSHLRRFPVESVKIDCSFIRDMITDPEAAAVTEAILAMARCLDLRVVAEGVESREQADFIAERGVHEVQGTFISPPVPPEELARRVGVGFRRLRLEADEQELDRTAVVEEEEGVCA